MDRAPQYWILAFNIWLAFIQLFISFGNPKLQEHVGSKINNNDDNLEFISIDCGLPANSSYTEPITNINYISDARFINSGVSKDITAELKRAYLQQMWNVRSFPEGIRNCYKINIKSGSKYLIRVNFLYGNYDGLNYLPKFDLHLGANWWDTVNITDASRDKVFEIIHIPPLDYISICLADTGSGKPFISSIELRLLQIDSYVTQSGSLALFSRLDFGSSSNRTYRFNYDDRDRFWVPFPYNNGWTQLSVPIAAVTIKQNAYDLPKVVMSTAATPLNASAPMNFRWRSKDASDKYYVYMHFTELKLLARNETRSFKIVKNGVLWNENVVPIYLRTNTIYNRSPFSGEIIEFSLERTEISTLPPIINAMEVYTQKDFQQSDTDQEDVDAITSIKSTYEVTRNWQGDPCGPVDYMWNGLSCRYDDEKPPRITTLDLSSSGLNGEIDPSIFKLTMLEKLDLSNNSLNGEVPYFLSELQSLRILNLENNNLTGSLPSQLLEKSKEGSLTLSVSQNPYLCESPPCNNNNNANNKNRNIIVPVVASLGGVLILLVAVAALFLTLKRRKSKYVTEEAYLNDTSLQTKRRQYSYSDILNMTNNFNIIIGKGGFGVVYLGYVDDTCVAVKMLSPSSVQGYQQFQAEVKLLMRVHHRNLTSLIGYCNEETNKGLIYEYMANGNLQEYLSGEDSKSRLLTWKDRLHIAMDAAQGLEYLHNGCKPPIIHRDVKSTNILLNEQFQAKLSDFGLSKIIPTEGETHVSTVVAGTPGYLDPEYSASNRITEKSDVYSFGVVLLEIITSQTVIARNHEKTHISQWVRSMVGEGDISNIVDSRLYGDFDSNSAWKAVEVALACVSLNSNRRPTMSEVVSELKECLATELSQTKHSGVNTGDPVEEVRMNVPTEFTPLAR